MKFLGGIGLKGPNFVVGGRVRKEAARVAKIGIFILRAIKVGLLRVELE